MTRFARLAVGIIVLAFAIYFLGYRSELVRRARMKKLDCVDTRDVDRWWKNYREYHQFTRSEMVYSFRPVDSFYGECRQ